MPWVTEEEIQAAKNITAYEYLRTHQAQRLQKTRDVYKRQTDERVTGKVKIAKIDKETLAFKAQGDSALRGAVYGLYAKEDLSLIHI